MAVLPILVHPHPTLRTVAEPVDEVNEEIQKLVDDMAETMYAAPGVGLAAPQVGVSKRVFVIDTAGEDETSNLMVFINPKFKLKEGEIIWEEGCLSFPGIHEEVRRADHVIVEALDRDGKVFEIEAKGLEAVALQHESDHLDDVLIVDHVSFFKKRQIERDLRKRAVKLKQAG
jgi:peptide deformylase